MNAAPQKLSPASTNQVKGPGTGYHPRLLAVTPLNLKELVADIQAEISKQN